MPADEEGEHRLPAILRKMGTTATPPVHTRFTVTILDDDTLQTEDARLKDMPIKPSTFDRVHETLN